MVAWMLMGGLNCHVPIGILFLEKEWLAVKFCKRSQKRQASLPRITELLESEYECMAECLSVETCEALNYSTTTKVCELDTGDQSSSPAEFLDASDFVHYTVCHYSDTSTSFSPLQKFSSTIQYSPTSPSLKSSIDTSTITSSTSTTLLYTSVASSPAPLPLSSNSSASRTTASEETTTPETSGECQGNPHLGHLRLNVCMLISFENMHEGREVVS